MADHLPKRFSINDVGCGHGDLFTYLTEQHNKSVTNYWGYDLSQRVLNNISDEIKSNSKVSFYCISGPNLLHTADYSVANGIFNTNFRISFRKQHLRAFEEVIHGMWTKSIHGVAFNVLVRQERQPYDGLFYFDQSYIEDFLASSFTDKFEVRSDYDPIDVSFFVTKT